MPDLLRTELPAFVAEYGSAGHHPEFRHSGEAADDSVCNSIREILDVGVSTHVYERQHSYGVNPPRSRWRQLRGANAISNKNRTQATAAATSIRDLQGLRSWPETTDVGTPADSVSRLTRFRSARSSAADW